MRYVGIRTALAALEVPRVVIGGGVDEATINEVERLLALQIPDE